MSNWVCCSHAFEAIIDKKTIIEQSCNVNSAKICGELKVNHFQNTPIFVSKHVWIQNLVWKRIKIGITYCKMDPLFFTLINFGWFKDDFNLSGLWTVVEEWPSGRPLKHRPFHQDTWTRLTYTTHHGSIIPIFEPVSYQCFQTEVLIQLIVITGVTSMNISALIIEGCCLLQTLKQNQKWNRNKAPFALQINMWHLWYLLKARFMLPC